MYEQSACATLKFPRAHIALYKFIVERWNFNKSGCSMSSNISTLRFSSGKKTAQNCIGFLTLIFQPSRPRFDFTMLGVRQSCGIRAHVTACIFWTWSLGGQHGSTFLNNKIKKNDFSEPSSCLRIWRNYRSKSTPDLILKISNFLFACKKVTSINK